MSLVVGKICPECHELPNFLHAGYCSRGEPEMTDKLCGDAYDAEWHEWRVANPDATMYEAFQAGAALRPTPPTSKVPTPSAGDIHSFTGYCPTCGSEPASVQNDIAKPVAWIVHADHPFVTMDPPYEGGLPRTPLFARSETAQPQESKAVDLLRKVYHSWALHGIAPELEAEIERVIAGDGGSKAPEEPTPEMTLAAMKVHRGWEEGETTGNYFNKIYVAMRGAEKRKA